MAATEQHNGGSVWSSAREFVEDRLEEMDEPARPCDLADEYDCSNAHMRHTLSDLAKQGVLERVGHGEYRGVSQESTETEGTAVEPDVSAEDMAEGTEEDRPSAGGAARSEDPGDGGGDGVRIEEDEQADVDTSEMDQDDEYEQQLEEASETVDGDESDEIEADGEEDHADQEELGEEETSGGVSPGKAVLFGTVMLIVLFLILSRRDDGGTEEQQEEEQPDESGAVDISEVWT